MKITTKEMTCGVCDKPIMLQSMQSSDPEMIELLQAPAGCWFGMGPSGDDGEDGVMYGCCSQECAEVLYASAEAPEKEAMS